jgi:thymidylate synthase
MVTGEKTCSVNDARSIGSAWGTRERSTKELRYITLILKNPQHRLINSPFFLLENVIPRAILATLSDVCDVQTMAFYNPKAPEFSDDGTTIPSNYGYRIRHLNHRNQIDDVVHQLRQDTYSRRAVIHIHAQCRQIKKKFIKHCANKI